MARKIQYNPSTGKIGRNFVTGKIKAFIKHATVWSFTNLGVLNWTFDTKVLDSGAVAVGHKSGSSNTNVIVRGGYPPDEDVSIWSILDTGILDWGFNTGEFSSGMEVDSVGNVIQSKLGLGTPPSLFSIDNTGSLNWSFDKDDVKYIKIDGSDNIIALTAPGASLTTVRSYDSAGSLNWGFEFSTNSITFPVWHGLTLDGNNNAIAISKTLQYPGTAPGDPVMNIISVDNSGALNWWFFTGIFFNSTKHLWNITADRSNNVLVVGETSGGKNVWSIDDTGSLNWDFDTGISTAQKNLFLAADKNGNVIVAGDTGTDGKNLWSFDNTGSLNWNKFITRIRGITTDHDGNVIVISNPGANGNIRSYDIDGNLNWSSTIPDLTISTVNVNSGNPPLWSPTRSYPEDKLILYDNVIWKSLQDSNLNHIPDVSPTWWETATLENTIIVCGRRTAI